MADTPRITHYLVADDTRMRFLAVDEAGWARFGDVDQATRFPDFDLARKARDAYASGYIAVPVVGAPENTNG